MPFINPYQYGGGVKFNVHAVHELPTSAKSDDIYLVFAAGTPLPDVSNIKTVALFAKFDSTLGNIYPDNTVVLFAYDGAFGTATMTVDTKGLKVDMPIATGASVVNLNGLQVECDVAVYLDGQWTIANHYKLPLAVTEKLISWGNIEDVDNLKAWGNLGLSDNFATSTGTNKFSDVIAVWGVLTEEEINNIHAWDNVTDSGSLTKNEEPTPF